MGSAPKQTELSVWALQPVGFVFILFLHNSLEHVCLSCLYVESSKDAGAASIIRTITLERQDGEVKHLELQILKKKKKAF